MNSTEPTEIIGSTTIFQHLAEILQLGGTVVFILILMSLLATTIVLLKVWQFLGLQLGRRKINRQAVNLYRKGGFSEATAIIAHSRNPVAIALLMAMRGRQQRVSEERLREDVFSFCSDQLSIMRAWLRPLEVIATLAPLMGLFGTVLGMIEAFQQMEAAGASINPSVLSGGIWEALLTTAVGLGVAIPVVVCLNWLERRIELVSQEMESLIGRVFALDLEAAIQENNDSQFFSN